MDEKEKEKKVKIENRQIGSTKKKKKKLEEWNTCKDQSLERKKFECLKD